MLCCSTCKLVLLTGIPAATVLGPLSTHDPFACQPASLVTGCSCSSVQVAEWSLQTTLKLFS